MMSNEKLERIKINNKLLWNKKEIDKTLKKYTENIRPTTEAKEEMVKNKEKIRTIIAVWPRFRPGKIEKDYGPKKAEIVRETAFWTKEEKEAFRKLGPVRFIEKDNLKTYLVYCKNDGALNAIVTALDETLFPWFETWHVSFHDKKYWYGARAVNVSPKDRKLGFECGCGIDTRDARYNRNLPPVARSLTWDWVKEKRKLGTETSAFSVVEYK